MEVLAVLAISAVPRNIALALALVLSLALGPAALLETAWAGAREPAADLAAVEASPPLDMVPAHFRERIQKARSLLPALMKRGEEVHALSAPGSLPPVRPEVSLDGEWSYYPIEQGNIPPAPSTQRVPQEFDGPETAWYALRLTVPEAMRGQRIYLAFEGVTLYAEVYVNGAYAGAHAGRFTPFEIDITDHVRFGEENLLHVLNASAALAYDPQRRALYYQVGGTTELERLELTPELPQSAGIWGSVTLSARHPVHVVDQYVITSVRERKLTAEVTLANHSRQSQRVEVVHRIQGATDSSVLGPATPAEELVLEPGQERVLTFEIPWPDPILWDLENPFLYWFTTEIAAGGELLDRRSVRFGFREFWIEGPHFLLNGHKVRLMGESGVWPKWDPRPGEDTPRPGRPWSRHDRPGVEALYRAYKAMNMTAVRLHYRVGNRVEIEVADELGLLVIPQSGLWTAAEPYERGGSLFFSNLEKEFEEWVRRDRNSPSVVFWDVENEILRWGTPLRRPWALRLEEMVQRHDRTRVLLHSGGGKFSDDAQVYSFHMAENYDAVFRAWEKQPDKPVILGEWWIGRQVHHGGGMLVPYGWSERGLEVDPHHLARRERIEMHRMAGVHTMPFDFDRSLIYPVLPFSAGRVVVDPKAEALYRDAFSPLFVGVEERGTVAMAGERISRTAVVINDTPRDLSVQLVWRWRSPAGILDEGEAMLALANGQRADVPIEVDVPPAGEIILELTVQAGGYGMTNEQRIHVLSPELFIPPSPLEPFMLYDPEGALRAWMDAQQISYRSLADLSDLVDAASPALIIGRNGLATLPSHQAQELLSFVDRGGRVLIMEQEARLPFGQPWHHPDLRLPTPWLPHGLGFWSADLPVLYNWRNLGVPSTTKDVLMSRYAAILHRGHPVVAGLPSQLIAHWRHGDGRVVDDAVQIPGGVAAPPPGVTPIVGVVGPHNASLVEARVGQGFYLINQLKVTDNLGVDPAATLLFLNMLRYLEPPVIDVQLPIGLAKGEMPVEIRHYAPAGWKFRSLRLWIDEELAVERDEPVHRLAVDTLPLDDGSHVVSVEVEYDTPEGSKAFRAGGNVFVSNWRRLEDELLPPQEGWFGGEIKQLRTEHETAGWVFLQEEPERYFGDASRIAPGAPGSLERLTWRMPQLKRFAATVYARVAPTAPGYRALKDFLENGSQGRMDAEARLAAELVERLALSASSDGERWTFLLYQVEIGRVAAEPARDGEDGALVAEITVAGEVPHDLHANWFSLTMQGFEEPASSWQLGRVELWGLR